MNLCSTDLKLAITLLQQGADIISKRATKPHEHNKARLMRNLSNKLKKKYANHDTFHSNQNQTSQNDKQKTITETYIFRAESFTEAEARAVQYANDFAFTEFAVTALTNCRCTEIVRQTNFEQSVPLWFRAKLDYITLDERTARERHTKLNVLVEASCFEHANDIVAKYIADSVADIRLLSLTETNIIDVITE